MSKMENLLVEILVEELPPKALKKLGDAFAHGMVSALQAQGLVSGELKYEGFATPRRLAVCVHNVMAQAPSKQVSQKLMPVAVGLKDGQATPALLKKLTALGVADAALAVQNLQTVNDGKADNLHYVSEVQGATLQQGVQKALDETLAKLPIPKLMSYQLADGETTVQFVRPAHYLLALHGTQIVPVSVLGLQVGRETLGHRFESQLAKLTLASANSYETQLHEEGHVVPSFEKRRALIAAQLAQAGAAVHLSPIQDEALLDEVTGLVEYPNVLTGKFEAEFLAVPQECLILTMKANQKYFPLMDSAGKLSNQFLIVSNISPADPSAVIQGNERVVRPRLADAQFFYQQDKKKTLAERIPLLDKVVYHNKLGTQGARTARVVAIAGALAQRLTQTHPDAKFVAEVEQAATLAKADLLTDMVGEFPELQGTMGRYYALHDGAAPAVADAIEDHYKPRFAGDALPRNAVGVCVALADKLETLTGLFSIGQTPTGDKDPFALRRHALGCVRILIEKELPITLSAALQAALQQFPNAAADTLSNLRSFIYERLQGNLREQTYTAQEVEAVLAQQPESLHLISKRLAAVRSFLQLPEAQALAAANKRIGNILKKSDEVKIAAGQNTIQTALLKEPAEQALHQAMQSVLPHSQQAFAQLDYTAALTQLAQLRTPVDNFFNEVMVNADDVALKNNRLNLLSELHQNMNSVADLSKLAL